MSPQRYRAGQTTRPIRKQRKVKAKRPLVKLVRTPPFRYECPRKQKLRLRQMIEINGRDVPPVFLEIMFGRARSSVAERLRRSGGRRSHKAGNGLFARWLKVDLVDELPGLSDAERQYLRNLREAVIRAYSDQRSVVPEDEAAKRLKHLQALSESYGKVRRVKCRRKECQNVFPRDGVFFPNLRHGGKRPGTCAVCHYLRSLYARRRRAKFGPSRPARGPVTKERMERFWEIEKRVRLRLPSRVLATIFDVSPTTINNLRTIPLSRKRGKAVFHKFQKLAKPPVLRILSKAENEIVAKEWQLIRNERSRAEFDSYFERRRHLLVYTEMQRNLNPSAPLQKCERCGHTYIADEYCFPYGRVKETREKVLRRYCRPCYAEMYPKKG